MLSVIRKIFSQYQFQLISLVILFFLFSQGAALSRHSWFNHTLFPFLYYGMYSHAHYEGGKSD